ncbi:MAG: response regulator [Bacteroidota bacterium]
MLEETPIKILLADDHKMVRAGMKQMLMSCERLDCEIDEADSGKEAIRKVGYRKYDIIFMDMKMPDMDGIEATKKILKLRYQNIVGLSMHAEIYFANSMLEAGARGYMLKNAGPEELTNAILTVMSGDIWISNEVSINIIRHLKNQIRNEKPLLSKRSVYELLSKREKEILQMIVNDMTNENICRELKLSRRTVETHRKNIMNKFRVSTAAGLVKMAIESKLVDTTSNA